ncbi:hypothetical protein APUTEX25_004755, partial [Auxenochlorella protothecoides]
RGAASARAAWARHAALVPRELLDEAAGAPHGLAVLQDAAQLPCFARNVAAFDRVQSAMSVVLRAELSSQLKTQVLASIQYRTRFEWQRHDARVAVAAAARAASHSGA